MRRERATNCSLLMRNINRSTRIDDIKYQAEKFGIVRDVYMPKDYYTGETRGIGFIEYADPRDAEDAQLGLDRMFLDGREVQVVFAQQGRKRPEDYRAAGAPPPYGGGSRDSGRSSRHDDRDRDRHDHRRSSRRRSYSRSPRRSYSRSVSRSCTPPRRSRPTSRRRSPTPPPRRDRSASRSLTPPPRRSSRRSVSRSPTPPLRARSYSRSPVQSPPRSLSRSPTPP